MTKTTAVILLLLHTSAYLPLAHGITSRQAVTVKHRVTVCNDDQLHGFCKTQSSSSGECKTLLPESRNRVSSFSIAAGSSCQFYDDPNCGDNVELELDKKNVWPGGWMAAENFKGSDRNFGKEPWTTDVGGRSLGMI